MFPIGYSGGFREGCGGCSCTPLGVLQKNSGSTIFENSEGSRQHDCLNLTISRSCDIPSIYETVKELSVRSLLSLIVQQNVIAF